MLCTQILAAPLKRNLTDRFRRLRACSFVWRYDWPAVVVESVLTMGFVWVLFIKPGPIV